MKKKLGGVIALIEIASITALLFLPGRDGLPSRWDIVLVFLLPITFGLHVFEEFIFPGGGPAWFKLYRPQYVQAYTDSYFFNINSIPLVLSMLTALGTFDFAGGYAFFGIRAWLAFLSFQALNAIFHIRGTFQTRRYSPGLAVSIVLYLPLTITGFAYLLQTRVVDIASAVVCLAAGSLIQPALNRIKERSLRTAGKPQSEAAPEFEVENHKEKIH